MKYSRKTNSAYATYRYNNPQVAGFIAPEAKVANFERGGGRQTANFSLQDIVNHFIQSGLSPQEALQAAQQAFGHAGSAIGDVAGQAGHMLGQGVEAVRSSAGGQAIGDALQQGQDLAGQAVQGGRQFLNSAVSNAQDLGSVASDALQGGAQAAGNAYQSLDPMAQKGALGAGILGAVGAGGAGINAAAQRFRQSAGGGIQQAVQAGQQAVQGLSPEMKKRLLIGGGAAAGVGAAGAGAYALNQGQSDYSQNLAYRKYATFKRNAR